MVKVRIEHLLKQADQLIEVSNLIRMHARAVKRMPRIHTKSQVHRVTRCLHRCERALETLTTTRRDP